MYVHTWILCLVLVMVSIFHSLSIIRLSKKLNKFIEDVDHYMGTRFLTDEYILNQINRVDTKVVDINNNMDRIVTSLTKKIEESQKPEDSLKVAKKLMRKNNIIKNRK